MNATPLNQVRQDSEARNEIALDWQDRLVMGACLVALAVFLALVFEGIVK
ncbi:hypothetical protein [Rhodoferax sp.]|nr:hypothetical protein [Rhodoferax sp.]